MNNETIYLLQVLDEAFENMTGHSLKESEKAAKFINDNSNDNFCSVSLRFLRDYWPSMVKHRTQEDYEQRKGKPIVDTIPSVSKLNLIAKCAGYISWGAFKNITSRKIITENTYFDPKDFKVEKMTEKDPPIIIGWYPHFFIKLQYLGNYKFQVLSYSYNLMHKYEENEIIEIYGFEVRYTYVPGEAIGLKEEVEKEEEETDEKKAKEKLIEKAKLYKEKNKGKKYVGGCSLFPELRILREPKNTKKRIEENECFIVRS